MLVDFHSHTYESDGSLSPADLIAAMHSRGVAVFAITDHDSLAACNGAHVPAGMRMITGIEVNTTYLDNEVHILGYALDPHHESITSVVQKNIAARRTRIAKVCERLQAAGYPVTLEQVEAESVGGVLGRPHVGRALIRHRHVNDLETAFRKLLTRGGPGYVPSTHMTPHEAIEAIHDAGGVAVLAHPGRMHDYRIIDELVDEGLDGLEVFYPKHDASQVHHFRQLARKHDLVMTAGSDFHDIRYHKRGVGMEVDAQDIRPFLEAVS